MCADFDRDEARSWHARVRAAWDERAPRWDAAAERDRHSRSRDKELARTVSALRLQPGQRLLDAGCGTGQWAIGFARHGVRVTAVDLSGSVLALAMAHAAEEPALPPIEWRTGDLARLPEPFAVFHAVHCRAALHFVPDVPAALREFRRVLRPGGRLLASVPGSLSPIYRTSFERHLPVAPEVNWITPWELQALLEESGWRIVDGWGDYGLDLTGTENSFDPDRLAEFDIRLQMAAATTWCLIAS